jgi:cation transport ATPase
MDTFQGSYRTHPCDMRYFSAYYLFIRCFLLFLIAYLQSPFYFPVTLLVLTLSVLIFSVFQPYKNKSHNKLDIVMMLMMVLIYSAFTSNMIASQLDVTWLHASQRLGSLSIILTGIILFGSVFFTVFHYLSSLLLKILKSIVKKATEKRQNLESLDILDGDPRCPLISP